MPQRFPMFNEPDASYHGLVYADHFGEAAYIARCRSVYQRTTGAVLAPLSAFLLLQGIETVALRVERHVENARRVAEFLRGDPRVDWVNYAGFADSPYHALAQKYLGGRACSLLTFGVQGGFEAGKKFYDALELIKRLVNMGDAKSLACHPASTTHRQMSAEEQRKAGVRPGDDPAQRRHRAHRRHHRRSRPGARRDGSGSARHAGRRIGVRIVAGRSLMPVCWIAGPMIAAWRTRARASDGCIEIGLVNNMPDAGARGDRAAVHRADRIGGPGHPRPAAVLFDGGRSAQRARPAPSVQRFCLIDTVWQGHLDGLIVTGTEPRAPSLSDEPYWPRWPS